MLLLVTVHPTSNKRIGSPSAEVRSTSNAIACKSCVSDGTPRDPLLIVSEATRSNLFAWVAIALHIKLSAIKGHVTRTTCYLLAVNQNTSKCKLLVPLRAKQGQHRVQHKQCNCLKLVLLALYCFAHPFIACVASTYHRSFLLCIATLLRGTLIVSQATLPAVSTAKQ